MADAEPGPHVAGSIRDQGRPFPPAIAPAGARNGCDSATGRRIAVTDALTNSTYTAYDPQGRVTNTWGATYPVGYVYDDYDRMAAMKTWRDVNAAPDTTVWLFDLSTGLLTNKVYADGKGPIYTYTPQGQLATRTWARGVQTTYRYDPASAALTNIVYSDGTPSVIFGFNRVGQQTTITDGTGTRSFSYNNALQLAAETNVFGAIQRSYDSLGRSAGFNMGTGYGVQYGYSDVGRFASVSSSVQSVSSVVTYSYLPNSDLLAGYSSSAGPGVTRAYEPNRNLITAIQNTFNAASVSRFDYANDVLGRRTQRIDSSSVTNKFGYNIRSELIDASMGTSKYDFGYDPIGNRLVATNNGAVTTYTADSLNQYTAINQFQPHYDLDGNLTNDGVYAYYWDAENRLIAVSNASAVASFTYDYMSRRVTKTASGTTRTFIYDGWAMIQESAGTQTNSYVYGLDLSGSSQGAGTIGGILSASLNGSQVFYYYDANGNVADLTGASGSSVGHYEFDPYGNATVKTGTLADANPFRFSTKYFDAETGMYYYGMRYYSPVLGRWISRDPMEEEGGENVYNFVGNNSCNIFDVLGLDWSNPDRNGGARANITCKCGDSVADLEAKNIIAFDFAEYSKWLKPEDGKPLLTPKDQKATENRTFSIPNTAYVMRGALDADDEVLNPIPAAIIGTIDAMWRQSYIIAYGIQGFKTIENTSTTATAMIKALGDKDIAALVYQGHGPIMHVWSSSSIWNFSQEEITPAYAYIYLDHGLQEFTHLGCIGSPEYSKIVTKKGHYNYNNGLVTVLFQGEDLTTMHGTYEAP